MRRGQHEGITLIERSAEEYYSVRSRFNKTKPYGLESTILFIYLNRNCFNGLWCTNKLGHFNVPYGGTQMGSLPPLSLFEKCSDALRCARIRHQDFRVTISNANENAFIYADPPYFATTERTFIEYGKKSFGSKDLKDLVDALIEASDRGAQIALTYHDAMPIENLPQNWSRVRFQVTRNVGGFSGSRKKQVEVLYTNHQILW